MPQRQWAPTGDELGHLVGAQPAGCLGARRQVVRCAWVGCSKISKSAMINQHVWECSSAIWIWRLGRRKLVNRSQRHGQWHPQLEWS